MTGLDVESVDDPLHFDREVDGAPHVVQSRHDKSTAGQIAVVQGADLLDTEILCGRVELPRQLVHDDQQLIGGELVCQLVEAHDVGKDHGDVLVILRDRLLTLAIALHHRLGHQRQQQSVVLATLLVEQLLFDREIAAHVVERHCEIAELVARLHRQLHVVVAGTDLLGTSLEPTDRPHEQSRQQHGRESRRRR